MPFQIHLYPFLAETSIIYCVLSPLSTSGELDVKTQHITIYVFITASDGICPKPKEGPRLGLFFL